MRMHGDTKFLVGAACVYKYIYIERERKRRELRNETGIPSHLHATQCCPKLLSAELAMRRKDRRLCVKLDDSLFRSKLRG